MTTEHRLLEDPAWGPTVGESPDEGHLLAAGPPRAVAFPGRVLLAGARIDGLALCEGEVYRTAESEQVRFGLAQVRRLQETRALGLLHVLFAPIEPRPLLLGIALISNRTDRPVRCEYTELWDVPEGAYRTAEGAAERVTPEGVRVLADSGWALRTRPPGEPPSRGLALEVTLILPARSVRRLHFAYVAPPPGEAPAPLVRAWRGDLALALARVSRLWTDRVGIGPEAVTTYRRWVRERTHEGVSGQ